MNRRTLSPFLLSLCFLVPWSASADTDAGLVAVTPEERIAPLEDPCFVQTPQPAVFDGGDRELWMWHESSGAGNAGRLRAAPVNDQGEIVSDFVRIDGDDTVSVAGFRIDQAPNGDLWAAWTARDEAGDHSIRVRPLEQLNGVASPETVIPTERFTRGVDVAAGPGGLTLAVWLEIDDEGDRIVFRPLSEDGEALDASRVLKLQASDHVAFDGVAVAAVSNTEFVVAWSQRDGPALRVRRLRNVGSVAEPVFVGSQPRQVDDGTTRSVGTPEIVALPGGGFAVAWVEWTGSEVRPRLRRYDDGDQPLGPALALDTTQQTADLVRPGLTVDSHGLLLASWVVFDSETHLTKLLARRIDADGTARGEVLTVDVAQDPSQVHRHPSPRLLDSGEILLLWDEGDPDPLILPPPCFGFGKDLRARRLLTTCGPDDGLCLRDERFQVQVAWNDPASGDSGLGNAQSLTSDTGLFWFFDPDNLELVTKVIDGRAVNGKFWFFYGALSNVGYEISVLDRLTSEVRRYENPPGNFASFGDVRAFPVDSVLGFDPDELDAGPATLDRLAFAATPDSTPGLTPPLCGTTENQLCLTDRFSVTVEWEDFRSGDTGVGQTIPLTRDTGSFWFFDDENVELVVKVLDARAVNGHFWVFYGSLTDVGFTLTVRDENTGAERTFVNPPGRMASDADVRAFDD